MKPWMFLAVGAYVLAVVLALPALLLLATLGLPGREAGFPPW